VTPVESNLSVYERDNGGSKKKSEKRRVEKLRGRGRQGQKVAQKSQKENARDTWKSGSGKRQDRGKKETKAWKKQPI